jgi:hypothetical protein
MIEFKSTIYIFIYILGDYSYTCEVSYLLGKTRLYFIVIFDTWLYMEGFFFNKKNKHLLKKHI